VRRRGGPRTAAERTESLVAALTSPECYGHGVEPIRVVETHISWVLLTGRYAYKIKKPLRLPFLDFTTLALRRHFCREELRVNRRLAPGLYVDVVPIGGSPAAPRVGQAPAFEYAVKMKQFAADALLDTQVARNAVPREAFEAFAARLASFHGGLTPAALGATASDVRAAALGNVAELRQYSDRRAKADIDALEAWTTRELASLGETFTRRAAQGRRRECHGDLHLKNLLWREGAIEAFDALEFDPALREIDVMSEVAFLAMDLIAHDRAALAYAFANRYLEASGDYDGVHVLRHYLVYRALVRAKVDAIKHTQAGDAERGEPYLRTALALARPRRPLLVLTHGLSGSGKTHVTNELIGRLPALRVRSDLERKRLHGLAGLARTGSAVGQGLYSTAESGRTYAALATAADTMLRHGFDAIVDATFLARRERLYFAQIAAANAARFAILDCAAPVAELKRRIAARDAAGSDASEANLAVLEHQLRVREPLSRAERRAAIRVDSRPGLSYSALARRLARR
jgi:aminoglycoside phosphotransferase family enzyme/predicted kinase